MSEGAADRIKQQYLGKWVEVELLDGRLIRGQLAGTDNVPNYILLKAEERWERTDEPRHIGMAMVSRKNTKKMLMISTPEIYRKLPPRQLVVDNTAETNSDDLDD